MGTRGGDRVACQVSLTLACATVRIAVCCSRSILRHQVRRRGPVPGRARRSHSPAGGVRSCGALRQRACSITRCSVLCPPASSFRQRTPNSTGDLRRLLAQAETLRRCAVAGLPAGRHGGALTAMQNDRGRAPGRALISGSVPSLVRTAALDPPFGAGLRRDASPAARRIAWQLRQRFDQRIDPQFNARLTRPFGLPEITGASTWCSSRLVLSTLVPSLSNKSSPEPPHVRYVGSLFSRVDGIADSDTVEAIEGLPRPRILLSLGTTYAETLLALPCGGARSACWPDRVPRCARRRRPRSASSSSGAPGAGRVASCARSSMPWTTCCVGSMQSLQSVQDRR
jgi:hypothetical protein